MVKKHLPNPLNVSGIRYNWIIRKERGTMSHNESKKYTLVEYTFDGQRVVSAIYYLDLFKFLAENKDARIVKEYASSKWYNH